MNQTVRVLLGIGLGVVVIAVLFTVVFPWIDQRLITNPVLGG